MKRDTVKTLDQLATGLGGVLVAATSSCSLIVAFSHAESPKDTIEVMVLLAFLNFSGVALLVLSCWLSFFGWKMFKKYVGVQYTLMGEVVDAPEGQEDLIATVKHIAKLHESARERAKSLENLYNASCGHRDRLMNELDQVRRQLIELQRRPQFQDPFTAGESPL